MKMDRLRKLALAVALAASALHAADIPPAAERERALQNEYRVAAPAKIETAPGPLAQRALALLRREIAALRKELKPWEKDPRAKLLTTGSHVEHGIRPNTQAMEGMAIVVLWSPPGEERDGTLADLIAMLRFVAQTHSAGPLTCNDGKKWQAQWQSALWAAQAGMGAWLVWDKLDSELQWELANIFSSEADRFVTLPPPHQIKNDTKAEENAWNAMPVSLSANMFPGHPHAAQWRETAIRWQLSSFLTEADTQSDKVVDGKPLRDWKFGPNIHPDFSLENHGRVHPSYMGCIGINLGQEVYYRFAGNKAPEATRYNAQPVYEHLKFLSHPDGRCHFPNGQDWELHRVPASLHAIMNVMFKDAAAAYIERCALETCELMQARTGGRTLLKEEYFFPSMPSQIIADYAHVFMVHLLWGEGVDPLSQDAFENKYRGVRNFEFGQFLAQRTPEGFVSFSWGSRVMGQAIPFVKDLLGSPNETGFIGRIAAKAAPVESGVGRRRPKVTNEPVVNQFAKFQGENWFAAAGAITRAAGNVSQQIVFASLPEGQAIYCERLCAQQEAEITQLETGLIGVLNEPEWVYQKKPRRLVSAGGEVLIDGLKATPAQEIRGTWMNVEDCWGFVARGAEGWRYDPNTKIERGRREQPLFLLPPAKTHFAKDELIAQRVLVCTLKQTAAATAEFAKALEVQPAGGEKAFDVRLPRWQLHVNFAPALPEVKLTPR